MCSSNCCLQSRLLRVLIAMKTSLSAFFCLVLPLIGSGCATSEPPAKHGQGNDQKDMVLFRPAPIPEYHLGVDDLVQINVWGNDELSVEVPVRPDGKISMPLIGDVQAGGRTPMQVAKDIRNRLSRFIRNPNVTVMLTELRSHEYLSRVRVTGAVNTPVSLPYRQGMTVIDAVLAAGGLSEFADSSSAKLYRKRNGQTHVLGVDLEAILEDGKLKTNYDLQPGDIITVPERLF